MSTILRSGKFIRCFASAARTILSPHKTGESNLAQSTNNRPLPPLLLQSWNKYSTQQVDTLEPLLQRLDSDVRKFGRLSRKDLDEMIEEIRQKHYVSSSQSLLIIRCCGDLVPEELPDVRTKLVKEIWNILVERGVPMDISHYNALLRVYIENEHNFSPEEFLQELEGKGIQPNRVTYQRLMWRYCQHGDVEGASRILELMRSNQLPLSNTVLDALVLGHARLGDLSGAKAVVTAMGNAGLEAGPRTYALLAGCSGARGDTEQLKKILQESVEKEIYLSDKDLMDVIEDCAVGGHEENIEFILGQMQHTAGYNTDAITLIYRLIALGCDKAAVQVFRSLSRPASPTTEASPNVYQGAFFIKQLVKSKRPQEVVISLCKELQNDGSIPKAFIIALDAALYHGNKDLALKLFNILHDSGETVRQHYFWPLLVSEGKKKNYNEIYSLLKTMTSEHHLRISSDTLKDYVLPYLTDLDPDNQFARLREQNVSAFMAGRMIVNSLLSQNKIKKAAEFTTKYGISNHLAMCKQQLMRALQSAKDIDHFVAILHSGVSSDSPSDSPNKGSQSAANDDDSFDESGEQDREYKYVVGSILKGFVAMSPSRNAELLPEILEKLHTMGIGITVGWAEKIQEQLGGNMTNTISEALAKLTADDLEPKQFNAPALPSIRRPPEMLEKIITNIEEKGEQAGSLKRKLLLAYMAQKQTDKMEQYISKLENEKFVFPSGLNILIQDYYVQEGIVDKALAYYDKIKQSDPSIVIDEIKILRLVNLLVLNKNVDKALEILESQPECKNIVENDSFMQNSLTWRIMNTFAEAGDVERVNKVFNLLLDRKLINKNNASFGPLVKVHLVREDVGSALNEFEQLCKEYKCTPMKNELTKKLISMEDASGLQKLTDLSTAVHGEVNSLYDLVFGFVECGRVRQARRILETPGMRTRSQRFNNACERYAQEGKVDYLEGLLEATRELSHIDRSQVFQQLLNTYIKEGATEKALGLWTLLQEECERPTDKFLLDLAEFLKKKNVDIPFVVPEKSEQEIDSGKELNTPISKQKRIENKNNYISIRGYLQNNKVNEALALWRESPNKIPNIEASLMIEQLVKTNQKDEAVEVMIALLKANIQPLERVTRFLLNHLANNGAVEQIDVIGKLMPENSKKNVSFHNRRYNAVLNNNGSTKVIEDLKQKSIEDNIDNSPVFPSGAFLGVLSQSPDNLGSCMEIADNFYKKGIISPANMIWIHHIVNSEYDKAKIVWDKYLSNSGNILFKRILTEAKNKNDLQMIDTLLQNLNSNPLKKTAMGLVYSAKINILVDLGKLEESEKVIDEALSTGCTLEQINNSALKRLMYAMQQVGKEIKYNIPEKQT